MVSCITKVAQWCEVALELWPSVMLCCSDGRGGVGCRVYAQATVGRAGGVRCPGH